MSTAYHGQAIFSFFLLRIRPSELDHYFIFKARELGQPGVLGWMVRRATLRPLDLAGCNVFITVRFAQSNKCIETWKERKRRKH